MVVEILRVVHPFSNLMYAYERHQFDRSVQFDHLLSPVRMRCIEQFEIDYFHWENFLNQLNRIKFEKKKNQYHEVIGNPIEEKNLFQDEFV